LLTLIKLNPDEIRKPRTYRLEGGRAHLIGRRHGDVQLLDSRVSRQHAELSVQNGTWVIRDLNSSNGSWVNGERITGLCELEEGDRLTIGRLTLIVGHIEVEADAKTSPLRSPHANGTAATSKQDKSDAEAGSSSSLTIDFNGDDALEIKPVEGDEDVSPGDAAGSSVEPEILPAKVDRPNEPTLSESDEISDAAATDGDLIDLRDPEENASVSPGDSSLVPAPRHDANDAPLTAVGITGPDPLDELETPDEYTASDEFVTPISRPDSPLDLSPNANADDNNLDINDPQDAVKTSATAGDDAEDDAPAVVGLSLDMPAPEIDEAQDDAEDAGDLSDFAEELELDHPVDQAESAGRIESEPGSGSKSEPDDTGLDFELSDDSSIDIDVDVELNDAENADASSSATGISATPEVADGRSEDPDWVDSEAQQDLEAAWSGRGASRKKGVAVLVLMALVAGAGFWAISTSDTATPITGVSPDSGTTAAVNGQSETPLAVRDAPVKTEPTPGVEPQSPSGRISSPGAPAVPTPTRVATESDRSRDLAPAPTASASDAFGQAPTLQASLADRRPVEDQPATKVIPVPAPASDPALPISDVADESEREAAAPAPVVVADEAAAAPSIAATPFTPVTPTADREDEAGSVLAMIDLPPAVAPDPPQRAEVTNPAPPLAAVQPARRIAFVIDASGSMVDSMNQGALTWLGRELELLTDRDEFTVLFFRSDEVIEVPPRGMKTVGNAVRERALAWVAPDAGNIRPRGKSEPVAALQQAQRYRPTDLYILSDDKFGQGQTAADLMARDLEPLFRENAPAVHTVQFFYPDLDDRPLEAIAQRFGGTYEFVEEPPFDLTPDRGLGVDLLGISR